MAKATKMQLDFTNVKDGGSFNKKHQTPGDYRAKITKVVDAKSKKDDSKMWLFTIQVGTGLYPFYCKIQENQLWKIRNLFVAAGINVPKKRVAVDPNKVVGKEIGVTLEDEEYEGKMQSEIGAVFPTSELEDYDPDDSEDDDDDDDDEEEEDSEEEEEDDDSEDDDDEDEDEEDEEEEEPEPAPKKKKGKKAKEAPQGKKKKAKKVDDVDEDELEELEIEEI